MTYRTSLMMCVVAVLALAWAAPAQAAPTITDVSVTSGDAHISFDNPGPLVGAAVWGHSVTHDGIAFGEWTGLPYGGGNPTKTLGSGVSVTGSTDGNQFYRVVDSDNWGANTNDYQYKYMCQPGNREWTLTFNGLSDSETYIFQFGYFYPGNPAYDHDVTLSAGSATATPHLNYGDLTGPSTNDYDLLTATVSGATSFQITMPGDGNSQNQLLNAFSVHTPEPATLALLGLGGMGMLLGRRRRR